MIVKNENQLIDQAYRFGKELKAGDVVILNGELGAGKTTFVKGIAKALGIKEEITSPTYTISKLYDNILCHVDGYRILNEDIGLEDLQQSGYIICIEWAVNIGDYLPPISYQVDIEYMLVGRKLKISKLD